MKRLTKKFTAVLLAVLMIANIVLVIAPSGRFGFVASAADGSGENPTVWDGTIASGFAGGSGSSSDPYIIETAEQLAYFASSVNGGNNYKGKYIVLDNDIYLNDISDYDIWSQTPPSNNWTAIGESKSFYGNFDGKDHTIYGMYSSGKSNAGLFGGGDGCTVKNINMEDIYLTNNSTAGGIFSYIYSGSSIDSNILNCNVSGVIIGSSSSYNGGIAGKVYASANRYNVHIDNCTSSVHIKGGKYSGGISGYTSQDFHIMYVSNCMNYGAIEGTNASGSYGAGIIGYDSGDDDSQSYISTCVNLGDISGYQEIGGILGYSYPAFGAIVNIDSCYNVGNITTSVANSHAGGIIGVGYATVLAHMTITNTFNVGSVHSAKYAGGIAGGLTTTGYYGGEAKYLKTSCNVGSVTSDNTSYAYSLVGTSSDSYYTNCYYLDGCAPKNNSSIGKALTESQMKDTSSFSGIDFSSLWAIDPEINDGYPYLRFNKEGLNSNGSSLVPLVSSGNFHYRSDFIPSGKENDEEYDKNLSYEYAYDENWFEKSAYEYQHDLTKMSIRMAMAAYGYGETNSAENIVELFTALKFSNIKENYVTPNTNTIGYAIGSKRNIHFENGETASLIVVGVRGGNYGSEWGGNFNVGYYGVHEGFQIAADQVLDGIESYVEEYGEDLGNNIKVWIAGYSRGAATTNLVAKELDLGAITGITADDVYAFCFECPQNTVSENAHHELFDNIVSIVNPIDFVPYVAMSDWNFTRYGKTYYLPFYDGLGESKYAPLYLDMVDVYKDILSSNGISTDFGSTAPWDENKGQAEILNNFWNSFASCMTSTVPWLPIGSTIVNKLVVGEITYTLLEDVISEAEANGSTKERIYYVGFHQENFIKMITGILGDNGLGSDAATSLVSEILKVVPGFALFHPILIGEVVELFATHRGQYSHYAELCLAWIDSLEGEVGYVSPTYRRVLINCPVDVTITDSNGVIVAEMIDDVPQTLENGIFTYVDDDGQKVFILPDNEEYTIEITATNEGTVTYTVNEYNLDTNSNDNVVSYYELLVNTGDVLVGEIENLELTDAKYPLSYDGSELIEADVEQRGDEVVKCSITVEASENGVVKGAGEYTSGQYTRLIAIPNEGYCFTGWYQGDNLISKEKQYRILIDNNYTFKAHFEKVIYVVSPDSSIMLPNENITLTVSDMPDSGISWISGDKAIATVDENGTVTAHALGTVTITAKAGDYSASSTVEVVPPISLTALGGSVRIVDPYGLRFGIQLLKDDAYKQYKDIITGYGTLIIPKKNLGDNALTFATDKVKDVPAVNIYSEDDSQLTYTGVLVGIPKTSFYSDIVGRGYLKYKDIYGNEKVMYTDEIVRSYYQVANSAYTRYGKMTNRSEVDESVYQKLEVLLAEMTDGDNLTKY